MLSDDSLALIGSAGAESRIPWWRLFRLPDEGTTHRFARLDKRDWELRVTSGADQELLSQVGRRPLARVLYPLRKIQFVKTAIGSVVLLAAIAQHFPPDWTAKMIPDTLENRLVDSVL